MLPRGSMNRSYFVYCLIFQLLFFLPTRVFSRTFTQLNIASSARPLPEVALETIHQHAEYFGMKSPTLQISRTHALPDGQVLRFQQTYNGLPVVGGEISAVMQQGRIIALTGQLFRPRTHVRQLKSSSLPVLLTREQAEQAIKRELPTAFVRHASLAYWAGDIFEHQVVWRMDVATTQPFGLWEVFLGGRSGKILWKYSTIQQAEAKIYEINPLKGSLVQKTLQGLSTTALNGQYADVYWGTLIGNTLTSGRRAKPDTTGDYLNYAPLESSFEDAFAEVQAYYYADTFHRWLVKTFSFARPDNQQIKIWVNFREKESTNSSWEPANAFCGDLDGDNRPDLVFGQGSKDYAYDGDVLAHEFTHSIIVQTSALIPYVDEFGLNLLPLTLNEGFADLFPAIYTEDSTIAEYALGSQARSLVGSASCPDNLTGDPHLDGLIWTRGIWTVRSQQSNKTVFDQLLYKTMVSLTPHANFSDAASLFVKFAQEKDANIASLLSAEFKKRGVDTCSRILPLKPNEIKRGYIQTKAMFTGINFGLSALQYKIEVPQTAVKLDLSTQGLQTLKGNISAYVRRAEPVKLLDTGTLQNDFILKAAEETLSLSTSDAQKPLVPGATYYILPTNEKAENGVYQISYSLTQNGTAPDGGIGPLQDFQPLVSDTGALDPGIDSPFEEDLTSMTTEYTGCSCSISANNFDWMGVWGTLILLFLLSGWRFLRKSAH